MKRILLILAMLPLAACAGAFSGPRNAATAKQMDACQRRADEIYAMRNPGDRYRADAEAGGIGSPFSGPTGRSTPDLLGGRHAREQIVNDCLNGQTGTAPTTTTRP